MYSRVTDAPRLGRVGPGAVGAAWRSPWPCTRRIRRSTSGRAGSSRASIYSGLIGCAAARVLRARRPGAARAPRRGRSWALGLAAWMGGELYWTLVLNYRDVGPGALAGRRRSTCSSTRPATWRSCCCSGAACRLPLEPVAGRRDRRLGRGRAAPARSPSSRSSTPPSATPSTVAVNLAYPLGDLLLLSLVVGELRAVGLAARPRLGADRAGPGPDGGRRRHLPLPVGQGHLRRGHAARRPVARRRAARGRGRLAAARQARGSPRLEGWRVVAIPFAAGLAAVALLAYDHFDRLHDGALVLATDHGGAGDRAHGAHLPREPAHAPPQPGRRRNTDALTGLRNRRRADGRPRARAGAGRAATQPRVLVLFDLDGFKQYNDAFGHLAGDALLARLGARLERRGRRPGPRLPAGRRRVLRAVRRPARPGSSRWWPRCAAALTERGEGFSIGASHGAVMPPDEAEDADRGAPAGRPPHVRAEGRRARCPPGASRATCCSARSPSASPSSREHLARRGRAGARGGPRARHEPGGARRGGPRPRSCTTSARWRSRTRSSTSRARSTRTSGASCAATRSSASAILLAAPALRPVARLVRSSHERWDGGGYPDGLAGEEIPLGARIVAVCDAYDAMTTDRPYRRRDDRARRRSRSCGAAPGTQFDPRVVDAFVAAAPRPRESGRAPRAVRPA